MNSALLTFAILAFFASVTFAADISLKTVDKTPPAEIAAPIRSKLQAKALQLIDGDKVLFEFWLASEVGLKAKPESAAKALDAIKPVALLGALSVPGDRRDYRDDELYPGVYTLRFALQPQDGNHLGTSEYPYFAVLVPAKSDSVLEGFPTEKSLNKASSKDTSTDHPVILSLRPFAGSAGDLPKLNQPAPEHRSLVVKVPGMVADKREASELVFEIVYYGKGKK